MKLQLPIPLLLWRQAPWFVLVCLLLLAPGCRTLQYREVQRDFQEAVRADNAGDPFANTHESIVDTLTPSYIATLEPRLRANAWMLRAVSAWRSANYRVAMESVQQGSREPMLVSGSRDDVLLTLLPALVVDSEQTRSLHGTNNFITRTAYRSIEAAYQTALGQVIDAQRKMSPATPEEVRAYLYYQRWRLLQHWTAAINRLDPAEPAAVIDALAQAKRLLGMSLEDAINKARDDVPRDHPLRALIRAQGGQ